MPQIFDDAELQFTDSAPTEINPEELVLQPHPVLDRSAEELAADESFDPVQYASDFSDQIGEADTLVKLAKVDRLRAGKRTIAGTAAEVVKSGVELAKEAPGMAKALLSSAGRLALGANPNTGLASTPTPPPGQPEAAKELAAGADTAGAGYATMLRAGQNLVGKLPVSALTPFAGLFPSFKISDVAKFFNPESDLVSPENLTDEQYVNKFAAKVAERKSSQEAAVGEGPLATALDFDPDVKVDPLAVQAWSLVVDPLNLVPGAEGFSVVSKSGATLARAATERAAKSAMEKLGGYVASQGSKMVERGQKTSRTAASTAGAVASSLVGAGPVAGAVVGALTPPAQKLGGWVLEQTGNSIAKGPGLGMKAAADVVGGAAAGAATALNPIKNPVAVLPLAAAVGADSDAEGGAMLGGPIAFGALGGAVAGKVKAAKRVTQAGTEAALRSLWQAKQRENTPATPLGADPVLDNAHTAADATLRQSDPAAANSVNWIRNRMRESFGSELYLLDGAEFSKRVGAAIGAPEGTQFDAAGFFDANTGRVYLNSRATALGHEVGHAIFASMDTGSKVRFIESLQSAYGPELLQQFGDRYNELLAAGKGTEALKLDSADQILEEMAAEVLTRVVNSESFGENPPGFLRRAAEAATTWAEQLGLYEPALGGENSTALGVGTPAEATKLGAEAVRARAAGDAPTPPPVPPNTAGAGTPPPVPPAGGRASSPPTPPTATAAAAPAAPTPSGTNIRVTPEEQAAADARRKITNATEAEAAISRSPGVYTPENARVFAELNNAMQRPQGEVAPVSIQYRSVNTSGPDSGRSAKLRKAEQDVAYAVEQLGLPADLRTAVEKTTIPYRWTVRDDNVNLNAMSVDKVLANAGTIVDKASAANASDLIPYANAGGRLTEAGWRQFVADTVVYTRNQANGYGGDGSVVSQPPGYRGDLPPVNQTYRPTTLPKANADFINLAMALPPPRTSRAPKGMAGVSPENFPNPQAVKLAKGNLRPVVEPAPTAEAGKEFYTQKGANIPIGETNPLRAQFADRGVDFTGRELFQVTEELNLQDIGSVQSRPQSQFRAPSTDLIRGGFMPEVEVRSAETENRAKRGSFMPDPTAPRPSSLPKNPDVRRVADEYTKSAGLTYRPFEDYVPVVEERAKRLADAYQAAPDQPNDPKVKQAYAKLADETVAQYRALEAAGYKLEPWEGKGEPYKSSAEMAADVRDNKHLWFFLTDNGFGTQTEAAANNPLLAKTGITINGRELLVNDVFRGVHDFFGHAKEGYQFGPQGEYNAYLAHARMFSDDAIPALASETLAQNSWVNYGPHLRRADGSVPKKGDADYVPITERPFADQKATWLPPELIREATPGRFMPATTDAGRAVESRGFSVEPIDEARFGTGQFGVSIRNPAGKEVSRVTAYSEAPGKASVGLVRTDPAYRRQGLAEATYRELGNQLQAAGVERLTSNVVNPDAVVPMTEKVFGPSVVNRPIPGTPGYRRVVSEVRKDAKFMPSMEEYEARRAARAAAAKQPAPAPEKFERPAPGKPQHVARPALPESVGDSDLRLIHYSGASGLAELDPKFMGKGNATPGDLRGLPKTYFFVEGSKTGADKPISGGVPYGARVHGGAIYDLVNGSDPLNWLSMPNRQKADQALLDAGYAGLRVKSQGRDVVAMLKPTAVTELGPKGKPAATAKAPAGAPKFMPEVADPTRIEQSIEDLDSLGNKGLPQVNAKNIPYPGNPAYPESIAMPARWGLVNEKIVGMPKTYKEVSDIVVRQVDRLERAIQDMPEFAKESARFYLDMGLSSLDLAAAALPGASSLEQHKMADLMLRFLALGSPRTGVAANATKSSYSVSAAASDFTPGWKIGFGAQQRGAKEAMASWKNNQPFNLDMPGIDNKVRNFYLNGIAEIIDLAKTEDPASYEHLMNNVAGSLGITKPGEVLPKGQYAEVQRLLDGMATVDMWDMAAKGFAWPGYLIDPAKRNDAGQPWQWSQDKFSKETTLSGPEWPQILAELSKSEKRTVAGPEDLRYQQARALRVEGNKDWSERTWNERIESGEPFGPETPITVFTEGSEAGLSPGGSGPLYDAQQSVDGLIADEINRRGLAPLFGKEKLLARNAQEILWALERLDNPVEINNELALFGQTFGAVRDSLQALQLGENLSPESRGEKVLNAMDRAYEQMAAQDLPIEVVSAGTTPEADRIRKKIAELKESGVENPERVLTEAVASRLLDDINTAAETHGLNVVLDSVRTGLGGYSEGGSANTAPNMVLRLRGSTSDVRRVLEVLSRSMDQDGGNIFRRPTIRELNDPKTRLNNVFTFDTENLSPEQQKAFFEDLNGLRDAEGNAFLTGFTQAGSDMVIGDQFYSGDVLAAFNDNRTKIAQIMARHGVEGVGHEKLVVDTFRRGTPAEKGYAKNPFVKDLTQRVQAGIDAAAPGYRPLPAVIDAKARLDRLARQAVFKRFSGKTEATRYFVDLASQVDVAILREEITEQAGEALKSEINRTAKRKIAQAAEKTAKRKSAE